MLELQMEINSVFNTIRRHLNQGFNDNNLLDYMDRVNQCTNFDCVEMVWQEFCSEVGGDFIQE